MFGVAYLLIGIFILHPIFEVFIAPRLDFDMAKKIRDESSFHNITPICVLGIILWPLDIALFVLSVTSMFMIPAISKIQGSIISFLQGGVNEK
jgi:hypothetical protein